MERKYLKALVSGREVLKSLRALMTQDISPQERLNQIVALVADRLGMDVCSCYIMRPGDMLELCATKGLDQKAVHETFLRVGEGLVGEIALQRKSLIFEDAWNHPSFVHKPETKEKAFKSLMGVPVLRGSHLLGVLTVQTRQVESFPPETAELLETVAMLVAEMLFAHQFQSPARTLEVPTLSRRLEGVCLIDGIAVGRAVIHQRMHSTSSVAADDPQREVKKLKLALKQIGREVSRILANPRITGDQAAIFETYLMFTRDQGWIDKMVRAIESGLTAEAAVERVKEDIAARMEKISDPYIKERIHDFKDLAARLIRHLRGKSLLKKRPKLPKNTILTARSLGPAELLDYDISKIKGILLEEGSQTMHVVIVARALNIPIVSGLKDVCQIVMPGDVIALDAGAGIAYLNPSDDVSDEFLAKQQQHRRRQARYTQMKDLPAQTLDGTLMSLNINAGLTPDFSSLKNISFDGVGLYRTELPFMAAERLPDVRAQTDIYRRAILQTGGKPIVFRTLDIGSDKVLPYFQQTNEENPAMGWRSIRMTLDRRILLRGQLKAFIRASAGKELNVMFPMVTSVSEFLEAKQTFFKELERERSRGNALPKAVHVGTMLEVPALLFQLDDLLKHVDFVSVGTNDLSQFLFATDRGNPLIWNRYDSLSPAMLKTLKFITDKCRAAGVKCSVCGEMAGKPLDAIVLAALGYRSLSMNPASLGAVKAALRTVDLTDLNQFLLYHLSDETVSLRALLTSWARDHAVFI